MEICCERWLLKALTAKIQLQQPQSETHQRYALMKKSDVKLIDVLCLFNGRPSQTDMFDPKPALLRGSTTSE